MVWLSVEPRQRLFLKQTHETAELPVVRKGTLCHQLLFGVSEPPARLGLLLPDLAGLSLSLPDKGVHMVW